MKPIRILYVNGGPLNRGGIESYMMNYYRHFDRNNIQIDFVALDMKKSAYDDEILSLGGKVYYLPKKSKDYIGYLKGLKKIFMTGKYKIVHTHMDAMGMTVLKVAEKCNIPIRIAHSHNTQHLTNNFIKLRINEYARKNINKYATHMFACSEAAGRWLFGDKAYDNGEVELIKNAIEIDKFSFNPDKRGLIRNTLNIDDNDIVIGHVGRFDEQKNHEFLIKVFNEVCKSNKKYKLVLIGDGLLKSKIECKIEELELSDNIYLLGNIDNVSDYYNVFDLFVLPSLFEGLPVVGIEAQANGIPCIFSDTITREICMGSNVKMVDINDLNKWVEEIDELARCRRVENEINLIQCGYSIKNEAHRLEKKYLDLYKEER